MKHWLGKSMSQNSKIQWYPFSILHLLLHPSPFLRLPSSHHSPLLPLPLPQANSQTVDSSAGEGRQTKPVSMLQMGLQPSPFFRLPSSHASYNELCVPSPQAPYSAEDANNCSVPSIMPMRILKQRVGRTLLRAGVLCVPAVFIEKFWNEDL